MFFVPFDDLSWTTKINLPGDVETKNVSNFSMCRHDEMDRLVREKEASVAKVCESGLERERALQSTVRELSKRVEDLQGTLRQSQWTQQDAQKENEATIERYGIIMCLLCNNYHPRT